MPTDFSLRPTPSMAMEVITAPATTPTAPYLKAFSPMYSPIRRTPTPRAATPTVGMRGCVVLVYASQLLNHHQFSASLGQNITIYYLSLLSEYQWSGSLAEFFLTAASRSSREAYPWLLRKTRRRGSSSSNNVSLKVRHPGEQCINSNGGSFCTWSSSTPHTGRGSFGYRLPTAGIELDEMGSM